MKKASNYKWHTTFSIILFFLFIIINNIFNFFTITYVDNISLILISVIYGLLPDVDTTESKLGKILLLFSLLAILFSFIFLHITFGIILTIIIIFFVLLKHRGFTHTILASIIFSVPLLFVSYPHLIVGFISYIGHLLLDGKIKLY